MPSLKLSNQVFIFCTDCEAFISVIKITNEISVKAWRFINTSKCIHVLLVREFIINFFISVTGSPLFSRNILTINIHIFLP